MSCPWTSADECAMAREREVAGISDTIPACPVHGAHPDSAPAQHTPWKESEFNGIAWHYRQTCSCGWAGAWRSMPDFAADDHRKHVQAAARVVGEGNQRISEESER